MDPDKLFPFHMHVHSLPAMPSDGPSLSLASRKILREAFFTKSPLARNEKLDLFFSKGASRRGTSLVKGGFEKPCSFPSREA